MKSNLDDQLVAPQVVADLPYDFVVLALHVGVLVVARLRAHAAAPVHVAFLGVRVLLVLLEAEGDEQWRHGTAEHAALFALVLLEAAA